MVGFPQECASVVCRDFAPKVYPNLINRSSDLVSCFELLCGIGGVDVSFKFKFKFFIFHSTIMHNNITVKIL